MRNVIFILGFFFSFSATVNSQNHVQKRAESAPYVFEGKVVEQYSFWDSDRLNIYTASVVKLFRTFKGNVQGDRVEVVTLGGIVGDRFSFVTHTLSLKLNDEGVFFCEPSPIATDQNGTGNPALRTQHSELGFIKYAEPGRSPKAFDRYGSYQLFGRDLYEPILTAQGTEVQHLNMNTWEEKILEAAAKYSTGAELDETIIEFSFDNIQLSGNGSYVEFDVMAQSNVDGILFGKAEVYIQYDTDALGTNVVQSGTLEATKSTIIQGSAYSMSVTDEEENIVKVDIGSTFSGTLSAYPLSTLPEKLFHMKITVDNVVAVLIGMDKLLMEGNAWYYERETDTYVLFDEILVDDPITEEVVVSITGFTNPVTAGTFDTMTITGNNFGTIPLAVKFRNANDISSGITTTNVTNANAELVSWSNTEIKVIVPSGGNEGPAAYGFFWLDTPSGEVISDSILNIRYSVLNNRIPNGVTGKIDPYRIELKNSDSQGGYTFHLDTFLNAKTNCAECTEKAMCTWNSQTGVTWALGNETTISMAADDGTNVIFYNAGQTDTSFLQRVLLKGKVESCFNGDEVILVASDIDIEINGYFDWEFNCDSTELDSIYDYLSAIIHEFGHVHSLDHAFPTNKMMRPSLAPEQIFRNLHAEDINGGNDVIESSQSQLSGSCPSAITKQVKAECLPLGSNEANKLLQELEIYPNPFQSSINISFHLANPADVEACLIDLLGRRVGCMDFQKLYPGQHLKTFELSNSGSIPTGMYVLRIRVDDSAVSERLIKF